MTSTHPPGAADRLIDLLRAASRRLAPPPDTVLEAGRAAFTWHTVDDAELAEVAGSGCPNEVVL